MQNTETTTTVAPHQKEHDTLAAMHREDVTAGSLSDEDEQAYRELVEHNRAESRAATQIEVKDANTGEQSVKVVQSIGDAALHNPMAVYSEHWRNEEH